MLQRKKSYNQNSLESTITKVTAVKIEMFWSERPTCLLWPVSPNPEALLHVSWAKCWSQRSYTSCKLSIIDHDGGILTQGNLIRRLQCFLWLYGSFWALHRSILFSSHFLKRPSMAFIWIRQTSAAPGTQCKRTSQLWTPVSRSQTFRSSLSYGTSSRRNERPTDGSAPPSTTTIGRRKSK